MKLGYLCLVDIIIFYKREKCINSEGNVISFDIVLDHPHGKLWKPIILSQNMFKSLNKAFTLLHILYCLIKTTWAGCELEFLSPLFCLLCDAVIIVSNTKSILSRNMWSNVFLKQASKLEGKRMSSIFSATYLLVHDMRSKSALR